MMKSEYEVPRIVASGILVCGLVAGCRATCF
jgi:hypothetical protein